MHHTVLRGTALCGAFLRPPEIKSCGIIWCVIQREHIVKNRCDLLGFNCFQGLLSMQFIHSIHELLNIYCAFHQDILHFLNWDTALKNKIDN